MDETDSVGCSDAMFQHLGDRTHLPSTRNHYPTSCQTSILVGTWYHQRGTPPEAQKSTI